MLRRSGAVIAVSAAALYAGDAAAATSSRTVTPNESFVVGAAGFRGGAEVWEQLAGATTSVRLVADRHGRVRVRYRAPDRVGRYHLLFSGPAPDDAGPARRSPAPAGGAAVAARVPLLVVVDFTVVGKGAGSGIAGGSRSRPPASPGRGIGGQTAGPAITGADVAGLLGLAGALLVGGAAVVVVAGRRRPG
ncbi:MAG TPA: hypothetical protein VGN18_12655 [Jatrophihabitans sp.]|jgi:hypothetical protein|uniref:hypothetical protein n=1 Tax=Jatrophihabitans sp. TaxID=1932789 RepID=UPI002DFCB3AF|nr:hypothetical protein [Jatrophihabitans sp.]